MKKTKFPLHGWKFRLNGLAELLSIPLWSQLRLSLHFYELKSFAHFNSHHNFCDTPLLMVSIDSAEQVPTLHLQPHQSLRNRPKTFMDSTDVHCMLCRSTLEGPMFTCIGCGTPAHVLCAARNETRDRSIVIPSKYRCVHCGMESAWVDVTCSIVQQKGSLRNAVVEGEHSTDGSDAEEEKDDPEGHCSGYDSGNDNGHVADEGEDDQEDMAIPAK